MTNGEFEQYFSMLNSFSAACLQALKIESQMSSYFGGLGLAKAVFQRAV
jgi:hypothetical protein